MTKPCFPCHDPEAGAASPLVLRPPLTDARSYVHGADLFDCLAQVTAAERMARLRFVRLSDRPVELIYGEADHSGARPCGYFDVITGGPCVPQR